MSKTIKATPAGILCYVAIGYFVWIQCKKIIWGVLALLTNEGKACCRKHIRRYFKNPYEIDEDIPPYDEAITSADRVYSLAEEINNRVFGIQTMLECSFKNMEEDEKEVINIKRKMIGIHTYDILRNPNYNQQFQYFSADLPGRDDFIIDDDDDNENNNAQSDYVRILLSLAYLKPHQISKLTESKLDKATIMSLARDGA